MPLSTGTKIGPYTILAPLGAGGMGEVYRARDSRLDRDVAIKVLLDHLAKDSTALKCFEREAKAFAAVSHPNIVTIHDYAVDRKYDEAIREYQKLRGDALEDIPTIEAKYLGWIYGLASKRAEASKLLDQLSKRPETEKTAAGRLALIHLGLGDENQSLEMLEKAYENHETSLVWLKVHWFYDPLRDNPRFQSLVQRMNFPDQ